jgi:hypothetical protein
MKALLKALAGFQSECPACSKGAKNPFFKSLYATLPAIQHHIQPYLTKYGLVVTQINVTIDGTTFVESTVWHAESGESLSSHFPILVKNQTPQDWGSAVTYARRYSLSGLLNLTIEDPSDDDGNASSDVTIIAEKPWLNEGTEAFDKAKKFIADGGKITDVKKKYNISKKVSDLLTK